MYLELIDLPDSPLFPSALAFANVPWRMPLEEDDTIPLRVRRTVNSFHCQHGFEPEVRLITERSEEREVLLADFYLRCGFARELWRDEISKTWPASMPRFEHTPLDRKLAGYLGIYLVSASVAVGAEGCELTPLEMRAASEINKAIEAVTNDTVLWCGLYGFRAQRPNTLVFRHLIERKNLARAAESVGVLIVEPYDFAADSHVEDYTATELELTDQA